MPNKQKYMKNNSRRQFGQKFAPKPRDQNRQYAPKKYLNENQLQEVDVGITQFISDLEGFPGIIKARFSDFQVNEIDLDGVVAKLTDTTIPSDFLKPTEKALNYEDIIEAPISQIPQETWDALKSMVKSTEDVSVELDATNLTKEDRSTIHETIRHAFKAKIFANTVTVDEKKLMRFKKSDGAPKDRRFKWPEDKGEYVHFLLYKEALDTIEATMKVGDCLKMGSANFNYAGVKDKRAKTTQWFSVRQVEPWKLIVKTRSLRNIKIGNITFKDKPLKLGQLSGNQFRIALRNVTGSDELIEKSMASLKENGFINYYGLQRFGYDKAVPTFAVGVQLLLGNWKEAVEIILKVTESNDPTSDLTKAKKIYEETGNAEEALKQCESGRNRCIEYLLLSGLSKGHSNEYVNALESIPRNTRLLYIHSFQSLVWNLVASKRVEKFGLKPVEGDLVLLEVEDQPEDNEDETVAEPKCKVKTLTQDDCANYTIYDVVLPLPGYDITYPDNVVEIYKEILERHGLTLEMPKQKVKTYTLSGTYRKLLGQVKDLSWKITHYNDPNYNLIQSDLEKLKGFKEPVDLEGGKYKALVLEFLLTSSSYATMVLREVLKTDTSSSSHAKLNNYYDDKKETKDSEETKVDSSNLDATENLGLLGDAKKYEEFKKLVFGTDGTSSKRTLDDADEITEATKKSKTETDDCN